MVAELDGSGTALRTYGWLGKSGGLLWVKDHASGEFHVPSFDGNRNVTRLIKYSDRTTSAEYEYAPFGSVLRATGPMASAMPFRFSSEYHDEVTGLVYYGYRYYSPQTHRWLSKDPIGYAGGLNLYGFVGNDPVNEWDLLGLDEWGCVEGYNPWEHVDARGLKVGLKSWGVETKNGLMSASLAGVGHEMGFSYQELQELLAAQAARAEEEEQAIMDEIQSLPPGQQMVAIWTPFGIDFVLVAIPAADAPNMAKGVVNLGKGLSRSGLTAEDALALQKNLGKLDAPEPKPAPTSPLPSAEPCPSPQIKKGYRAVSDAELKDIAEHGIRQHPELDGKALPDKWFSETPEGAKAFTERFSDLKHVVEVDIPQSVYDASYKHPNIDGTGPGFAVPPEQLPNIPKPPTPKSTK